MPWLQRWLGQLYSKLYSRFERRPFTYPDALKVSEMPEAKLSVAFSRLHAGKALTIFKRTRPRVYRLLDPRSFLLTVSGEVTLQGVRQEQYIQLVYDTFRAVRSKTTLVSFAVYGSVARGEAGPSSDLDILVVSDDFHGSLASRIDSLAWVDGEVSDELRLLRSHGYRPSISLYPLRREEAERLPLLFLDLTEDASIIYDEAGFLAHTLSQLRARLQLMGARRVRKGNRWYWDLKPSFRFGELIQI